jgi:hypothetical protein
MGLAQRSTRGHLIDLLPSRAWRLYPQRVAAPRARTPGGAGIRSRATSFDNAR